MARTREPEDKILDREDREYRNRTKDRDTQSGKEEAYANSLQGSIAATVNPIGKLQHTLVTLEESIKYHKQQLQERDAELLRLYRRFAEYGIVAR